MTTYYSDHFAARSSATVPPATELPRVRVKMPSGINRVPLTVSRAYMDFRHPQHALVPLQLSDTMRLMTFKSSDRIYEIHGWWVGTGIGSWSGTFTINLGLWNVGTEHDGTELDSELFASAVDGENIATRLDLLTEAPGVSNIHRGLQLWEVLDATLGTGYGTDPQLEFDLVAEVQGAPTSGTGGILLFEALFAPAGK
jgi:hypothetical protein